jgi:hypothetical protein
MRRRPQLAQLTKKSVRKAGPEKASPGLFHSTTGAISRLSAPASAARILPAEPKTLTLYLADLGTAAARPAPGRRLAASPSTSASQVFRARPMSVLGEGCPSQVPPRSRILMPASCCYP